MSQNTVIANEKDFGVAIAIDSLMAICDCKTTHILNLLHWFYETTKVQREVRISYEELGKQLGVSHNRARSYIRELEALGYISKVHPPYPIFSVDRDKLIEV